MKTRTQLLEEALRRIANLEDAPDIDASGEWRLGMHCGVEDRGCSDRYEGADYGHTVGCEKALEWAQNEAKAALAAAKEDRQDCPYCENIGWYMVPDSNGEPTPEQCRWCYTMPNSKFNKQQKEESDTVTLPTQRPLTAAMDNVTASKLGAIAIAAGDPKRNGVGDSIDRGLILRRLLEEGGFQLIKTTL